MIQKIKDEQELEICETLSNPISFIEILFHDFDNLGSFDSDRFGKVRPYQYSYIGFDPLFFENSKLNAKENFEIKRGLSERYPLGGRLNGKSLFGLILDVIPSLWHKTFNWGVVSSLDAIHIRGVVEKIIIALENHPILRLLHSKVLRSPQYKITTINGCLVESVNNNVLGKTPGAQWLQKHCDKEWSEESSFTTDQISNQKLMSQSELGMISVLSGMTTFSKNSPMGRIFYDLKNQNKVINLPSYANPSWNEEKDNAAILEFGGKQSVSYRVQIMGEVVENCNAVYDIERIRETYNDKKAIKSFEVNRDSFYRVKEILVLERAINAEQAFMASDIGEGSAPTEIIVLFKVGNKYQYAYNITTLKLSADEEYELQKYVAEEIKANVIGIDTTSGGGKAVAQKLRKDFPENVIFVSFNEKIDIGFETEENGSIKTDKAGNYIYKQEYVVDWSIQQLKDIFYNNKIECPIDYKLDQQFSNIVSMRSVSRTVYGSKGPNHQHQAWQVWAICHWQKEFSNIKPIERIKPSIGVFNFS